MKKYFVLLITVVVLFLGFSISEAGIKNFERSMMSGEAWTDTVYLRAGTGYKFSASGCPRVESIGLYIMDNYGNVVKKDNDSSIPSLCYRPDRNGVYKIKVVLESTVYGASSGKVKVDLEKGCGSTTYYYYGPCY